MNHRMEKVNAEMQRVLSTIINDDLRNPILDDAVITVCEASTSPDFSQCKVYISAVNTDVDNKTLIKELKNSATFIKKEVAEKLNLKRTPELIFIYDESLDQGDRIMKLLESLNKSNK